MQKAFTNFSNAQKKVFPAFSFQFYPTANYKFSFYISLCEINSIKIQTMGLVLNRYIYFDVIIRHRLKKISS